MKKYHDQVLRNIYKLVVDEEGNYNDPDIHAELLTSAALPAHCYVVGFKTMNHAYDVCNNEQNTTEWDLVFLLTEFQRLLKARSYKQHNMPLEFYNFVSNVLSRWELYLRNHFVESTITSIESTLVRMDAGWGFTKQDELIDAYKKDNPHPINRHSSDWYDQENTDEAYQLYWKKYFAYRKTIRFGAYWTYRRIFENMLSQLKKVGNIE